MMLFILRLAGDISSICLLPFQWWTTQSGGGFCDPTLLLSGVNYSLVLLDQRWESGGH